MHQISVNVVCPNCQNEQTETVYEGDKVGWFCEKCSKPWESTPEKTEMHLLTRLNLPGCLHRKGAIVN